jgi:hypothetical protein
MFLLINIFQGNQAMPFLSMACQLLFRFIVPADWNASAAQAQSGSALYNSPKRYDEKAAQDGTYPLNAHPMEGRKQVGLDLFGPC